MTTPTEDQKLHMQNLLKQARELNAEVTQLQQRLQSKRDILLKVQGAVEYLTQVGVPFPKEEEEASEQEASSEEVNESVD